MAFEHYIRSGQKWLRQGYTTGTCAALGRSRSHPFSSDRVPSTDRGCMVTPKGLEVEARCSRQARRGTAPPARWKKTAAMTLT